MAKEKDSWFKVSITILIVAIGSLTLGHAVIKTAEKASAPTEVHASE